MATASLAKFSCDVYAYDYLKLLTKTSLITNVNIIFVICLLNCFTKGLDPFIHTVKNERLGCYRRVRYPGANKPGSQLLYP